MIQASVAASGLPCAVCASPRAANSAGQIRWHNAGHPAPTPPSVNAQWTASGRRLPVTVVIRPGDRVIYEASPNQWQELSVAALISPDPRQTVRECSYCHRRVLGKRSLVGLSASLWRRLLPR